MEAIDIEAKTIDEAIEKACREFKTTREKLKIEIIAEGNPGFLGFGSKKALIRAGIFQIDQELVNFIGGANESVPVILPETSSVYELKAPAVPTKREERDHKPEGRAVTRKPNLERLSKSGTSDGNCPRKPLAAKKVGSEVPSGLTPLDQPEAIRAMELVEGILSRMNIPAKVRLQETPEMIIVKIEGDGDGLLIGKRGQNLDAIQYIVNKAVHHSINDSRRIIIDTEEYRERRKESLLTTAMQTANKVKKTRKPITLGPMNPHDRRIIHIALKNEKNLTTKSRGDGEYRKIVIIPSRRGAADENG